MISSVLEHITPEQMFTDVNNPGEAVSAVRAIQKATLQGQRIYQITQQNLTTTLPNIHHDSATMDEIRNAVNAGKEVITHTDRIAVPGWSGAGYIILDPETGSGAYKIGGGENGGWYTLLSVASTAILGLVIFMPVSPILLAALGMLVLATSIISVILGVDYTTYGDSIAFIGIITSITGLVNPLLAAPKITGTVNANKIALMAILWEILSGLLIFG